MKYRRGVGETNVLFKTESSQNVNVSLFIRHGHVTSRDAVVVLACLSALQYRLLGGD